MKILIDFVSIAHSLRDHSDVPTIINYVQPQQRVAEHLGLHKGRRNAAAGGAGGAANAAVYVCPRCTSSCSQRGRVMMASFLSQAVSINNCWPPARHPWRREVRGRCSHRIFQTLAAAKRGKQAWHPAR